MLLLKGKTTRETQLPPIVPRMPGVSIGFYWGEVILEGERKVRRTGPMGVVKGREHGEFRPSTPQRVVEEKEKLIWRNRSHDEKSSGRGDLARNGPPSLSRKKSRNLLWEKILLSQRAGFP